MHEWPTSTTGRSSTKHSGHGLHAPRVALAAALRRLTGQPTTHSSGDSSQPHSDGLLHPAPVGGSKLAPSNYSTHHWELASEDQNSMHTAPLPPPTALEDASSRLAYNTGDSLHTAPADPYANTPTLNRDIWPVLPNVIVFSSHTDSSHEERCDAQSTSKPVDWTTKLGIGLTPQLASSQLSPTPARFKLSGAHRRPKHSFTSGRRRASTSYRPWRSYHRSSMIMNAYTSLARQEIEQERTVRRARVSFSTLGGSTFSASGSPRNSYMRRSRRYRSLQGSGDDGQRYWASNKSKASSHGHTHSSASTNQLRKAPSSNFNPAAQFCLGRPPQGRKKHHKAKIRREAGTTTSAKDFSDTNNSSTTSRSQTAPKSSLRSGKEGVKRRYRHAICDEAADQRHAQRVTSMPEQPKDSFEHNSPSCSSHSMSAGLGCSPQADSFMSSNTSDTRIHTTHVSPVLVRSSLFHHNEYFPIPDHSFRPLSLSRDSSIRAFPGPNTPGPSNWRELQTQTQTAQHQSPKRSRNLKMLFPDSREGPRPRKPKKEKKHKARADQRPWEYQVAEQLLMKSWDSTQPSSPGSRQSPSSGSRHHSTYHSVQSHQSSDRHHPSQTLSSTVASSHRQTPSSTQPQSPSSSSGVGTLGSFFSDWSRGHQTLPPPTSQIDSHQESLTESSMNIGSHGSFRLQRMMSTSVHHRLSDSSQSIEQIEMGVTSRGKGAFSQLRAPWGSSSLGVGSIPREYLKTPDRSSKGSLDSASRFTHQQFSPRTPNDLTHHDQAGLLLPSTGVPPLTSDHDNECDMSSLSSTSWYDAADGAIAEEPEIVEQDVESVQPLDLSQFRRRSQHVMAPIQRAISAAIVYDTSLFSPNDGHPVSWLRKASKLFVTCPNLQPTVTVSLSGEPDPTTPDTKAASFGLPANRTDGEKNSYGRLLPQPWTSSIYAHPKLAPDSLVGQGCRTHRSSSQSCLLDTVVSLPLPPKEIRTRSLFKPTDDPNFLSHPPSQLKQAWKNKTRKARALSEPIKTRHSSKLPADRQWLHSICSEGNVEPKHLSDQQASTKIEKGKLKVEVAMRQSSIESTRQQAKHLINKSKGVDEGGANRHSRDSCHSGQHDPKGSAVVRCSVDASRSALDASSSVEAPASRSCCGLLDTLALVPVNGWCFVFGFIFFPLWYLGSFYPSFNLASTTASDSQAPAAKRNSPMLIQPHGLSLDLSQPQSPLGAEAEGDGLLAAQQRPSHSLQRKRMEIRGSANGPLSGWPTRRHMSDSSSESEFTPSDCERGAQPDADASGLVGAARLKRARSVSSSEENRQPDFDKGRENKRGLGGFWSEIAPRCDIETAQAHDAPMWAYQRALYTWRLRCRVMAVIFPTITIPATLISVFVSTR